MSNVSGIGDAYYWSVFKIAEAFGLHRDTVKKRLLAANTPVAATVRGNPVYALQHVGPALFSVKHEAADSVHDPSRKHEREHTDIYSSCRLIVRKNGAEIYNRTALDNTLIYSGVIDMPAGHGHMTLEFSVSAWLVNDWYPTASISDLLVVVMKKATAGISIS